MDYNKYIIMKFGVLYELNIKGRRKAVFKNYCDKPYVLFYCDFVQRFINRGFH